MIQSTSSSAGVVPGLMVLIQGAQNLMPCGRSSFLDLLVSYLLKMVLRATLFLYSINASFLRCWSALLRGVGANALFDRAFRAAMMAPTAPGIAWKGTASEEDAERGLTITV